MKLLKKENERIATILAFALIPISGFAIDVYIPSFPHMVRDLHTDPATIKLTLTCYLVSYGLANLFLGSLLDSYGRYRINILSLLLFIGSNVGIILTNNLPLIIALRSLQGILMALIVLSRRGFFIDVYTGDKRAHYTALLNVVWSTAPIIAPFAGGWLQEGFGWRSNFYFLALYALIVLALELIYGGETIKNKLRFHPKHIRAAYKTMLSAPDFSLGMLVLGFSYSMVMVFTMSIPFIVEHTFHLSPVATGYCALVSGTAILLGGLVGKQLVKKPLYKKLMIANLGQFAVGLLMCFTGMLFHSIWLIMGFVFLLHLFQGFTYNSYLSYCLIRFTQFAAMASGMASGGAYIIFSTASYLMTGLVNIHDQRSLSWSYLILIPVISVLLWFVRGVIRKVVKPEPIAVAEVH